MDEDIDFDSSSPISLSPGTIWLNDMEIPEGSLIRQLLGSKYKLTCTFCLDPSSDKMVAKGIDFSETQSVYMWRNKKSSKSRDDDPVPHLFNAQTTSRSNTSFYLLFHLEKPASNTHIRILTLPVEFGDLEFSRVGECPSPRMTRIFRTSTPELGGLDVSFTYTARIYPVEMGQQEDIIYNIADVTLKVMNTMAIRRMGSMNGQKVTMRVHGRDYAGRANSVSTRGLSRTYVWLSDPKRTPEEVSKDQMKEEVQDLMEIGSPREKKSPGRKSPGRKKVKKGSKKEESPYNGTAPMLISPRRGDVGRLSLARCAYIPDNDEYGNPVPLEEFRVICGDEDEDPLLLEFYNFDSYPVSKRTISITYGEISEVYLRNTKLGKRSGLMSKLKKINIGPVFGRKRSPRAVKKLEFPVERGANVTLLCNAETPGEFKISGVSIQLKNYEEYFASPNK